MKKVLFASTALVAFAGAAAAEITLTGNAEMGLIVGDGGIAATDSDVEFFTDIDVTFTMTGTTDGGLIYGASVDLDESDGSNSDQGTSTIADGPDGILGTEDDFVVTPGSSGSSGSFSGRSQGGETIFISGGFGTLTAGDTDGALDWALTEVAFNSGSINDDETEHTGYNGNAGLDSEYDGQIVRYDYSMGDFGIGVSAEIDDDDDDGESNDPILGVGARYTFDFGGNAVGLALGYQNGDNVDALGASVNGTVYGFAVGVSYLTLDNDDDDDGNDYDHVGVGIGYTTGAISVSANYGNYDYDDGDRAEGFGVSAGYDLGGGASVQAGYGHSNPDDDADGNDTDSFDTFSFGVRMNF